MPPPKFNLVQDLISGAIMAATSVPQLVAYAETVGYAGYRGLSTAGPPLFAWGIATGSPWMNAGVTSITAMMAKIDLDGEAYLAEYGEEEYVRLVSAYSLYVGIASIFLAVVGFGKLAQIVPKPVKTGFKWGCSVGVVVSAIPNGLLARGSSELKSIVGESAIGGLIKTVKTVVPAASGFTGVASNIYAFANPQVWSVVPALLFFASTAFVMRASSFLPKWLPPGTEVIIATACATLYSINFDYEGNVVGEIPALDPDAGMSFFGGAVKIPIEFLDVKSLLTDVPIVERCFGGSWPMLFVTANLFAGINFLSIVGIASGFESENNVPWSAPRELIAQGISCGVAGAIGSAPVSGSMSRSLVSRMAGATSKLACIVTALLWIYMMPYMSIMSPTPKSALSAIIISAVIKGVVFPKALMEMKGLDFYVGWGTGVATALTSPSTGFFIGALLYIVLSTVFPKKKKIQ